VRGLPAVVSQAGGGAAGEPAGEAAFQALYRRLDGQGVPLRPYDQAWDDLRRLRAEYLPYLRATLQLLLVPPEFRNHAGRLPLGDQERAG
jgi:hypothetical protein